MTRNQITFNSSPLCLAISVHRPPWQEVYQCNPSHHWSDIFKKTRNCWGRPQGDTRKMLVIFMDRGQGPWERKPCPRHGVTKPATSFMRRGTVKWSQTKLACSLQCCKLTNHDDLLPLSADDKKIVCEAILCVFRAAGPHASPVPDYQWCESGEDVAGVRGPTLSGNTLVAGSDVVTVLTLMKM